MPLSNPGRLDRPRLVNPMRRLIIPHRICRQLRRDPWQHTPLLFLQPEPLHDRIYAGRGAGEDRRTGCRRNGQQICVPHSVFLYLFRKVLPRLCLIAALFEVRTSLPIASLKMRIASALRSQLAARSNRRIIDALKQLVCKLQMRVLLPVDMPLCQRMVVAADPKAHSAIASIRQPCIRNRIEVQIDHIIQGPHSSFHRAIHVVLILQRKISKG